MTKQVAVRRALLSVTDKTGVVDFARTLAGFGAELISTGGTAAALRDAGLVVRDISDWTGFPEMLDGRVKTLHPAVHGALLHRRDDPAHVAAVTAHGIGAIDMVVVNLYAFQKTAAKPGVTLDEMIENIDIGGPSMLRSAAKNFDDVAVVTDPHDYAQLADELQQHDGALTKATRWELAKKAFATTAAYDAAIATALETRSSEADDAQADAANSDLPSTLRIIVPRTAALRYGENPHQRAAVYANGSGIGIAGAEQLQGKELSFNNLVDLDACWALVSELPAPSVAIIKHTNPCGVATAATVREAYLRALESDPVSSFGGIIGVNHEVDGAAAAEMAKLFVEAIVAPAYTAEALQALSSKKNLRVVRVRPRADAFALKQISGGYLLQDADARTLQVTELKIVTQRGPTADELRALRFAWTVCKHVKSNAIVYARAGEHGAQTVGVGAGQMSRVDAARFGAMKAALPLAGTVAASDAFFPFADGLEQVADAGATAVIQPGGSVRDVEVIAAADARGIAMVFTGIRHFRHG